MKTVKEFKMLIESIAEADEAALVAEELHGEDAGVDKYEWIVDQLENTFDDIDIRRVITDLCVMDFNGPDKQMRVVSLHPGVSLAEVLENTGFEVAVAPNVAETPAPSAEQLALIAELDPLNLRSKQLKDNPPGVRNPNEE